MIYEWQCETCNKITDVERKAKDSDIGPAVCLKCFSIGPFKKVITSPPSVPFQTLRDSGMFADSNGNFAPRNV